MKYILIIGSQIAKEICQAALKPKSPVNIYHLAINALGVSDSNPSSSDAHNQLNTPSEQLSVDNNDNASIRSILEKTPVEFVMIELSEFQQDLWEAHDGRAISFLDNESKVNLNIGAGRTLRNGSIRHINAWWKCIDAFKKIITTRANRPIVVINILHKLGGSTVNDNAINSNERVKWLNARYKELRFSFPNAIIVENFKSHCTDNQKAGASEQDQTKNEAIKQAVQALKKAILASPDTLDHFSSIIDLPSPPLLKPNTITPSKIVTNDTNALAILDEISALSYSRCFNLTELNPTDLEKSINWSNFGFLFVESTWNGNNGKWKYAMTSPGLKHKNSKMLFDVIKSAKDNHIPVVFWNKEDPMHYEKFLPVAKHADIIYTTDVDRVRHYQLDVPEAKTDVLPFAADPRLTNPEGRFHKRNSPESVCFAGTYYSEGHEERNRQMDFILPVIEANNGAIYDRYSSLNNPRYFFPEKYRQYVRPGVPFSEMTSLYKKYRVFLNVNTIINSETMMSRRVYELLASGTPVVSAPSLAVEKQFSGIVQLAANKAQALAATERLLNDSDFWNKISHLGMREVLSKHSYQERADTIKRALSNVPNVQRTDPLVTLMLPSCRPKYIDRMIQSMKVQGYSSLEVAFALSEDFTDEQCSKLERECLNGSKNIKKVIIRRFKKSSSLGRNMNEIIKESSGDYIAKMDDDNFYFKNYISDLMLAFKFGDYDIVGKNSYYVYLGGKDRTIWRNPNNRHCESTLVAGDTLVIKREVFRRHSFPDLSLGEDSKFIRDVLEAGGKIYSADHYNFIKYRSANLQDHTWQAEDSILLKNSTDIGQGVCAIMADL